MTLTLRQIAFVADHLEPSLSHLNEVLGLPNCYVDPGVGKWGLENTLVLAGTQFIEIVAPTEPNTAAGRYLERRQGNGGYMIITQIDSKDEQDAARTRAAELGVRVAWEQAHETGKFMQLHPRDTGGTFLEIDWDERNEPTGNWHPAGGDKWKAFADKTPDTSITAAEIQTGDPQALAEKWATIAGLQASQVSDETFEIALSNGTVRFAPITDGRGPGLAAIDMSVPDLDDCFARAKKADVPTRGNQITICGVRINLAAN